MDIRSVHMDDSCWINPKEFRPERHLTPDGKIKKDATNLMSFGLGKRINEVFNYWENKISIFCTVNKLMS